MFKKILIANRGEIACRVIKTARRMGIATVAVYSEADREARHVELADESVCIGPPPSRESYLVMDKIIAACKQTGAEAVHPGYGLLSENPTFAEAVAAAGAIFIGPPPSAMRAMSKKTDARATMIAAGVPQPAGIAGPRISARGMEVANTRTESPSARVPMNVMDANRRVSGPKRVLSSAYAVTNSPSK